jgi:hypothetical protein
MLTPRLVVVIPTLGTRLDFLARALESCRELSSLVPLRICVVVPHGATEARIMGAAAGATLVDDPGSGMADAVNAALSTAKSEDYYVWLGDDDLLVPAGVRALVDTLDNDDDCVLAYGGCEYVDGLGRSIMTTRASRIARFMLAWGPNFIPHPGTVIRISALREVGLSAGEPPTRRGFPPSVFSQLPRLLERAGQSSEGAITGFYTVLEETDDGMDPVSEEVRSLLDGHIVLSRKLAEAGHYPAIDILASTSRVMSRLVDDSHRRASVRARELWAKFQDLEILIQVGEYRQGEDANADMAVAINPELKVFLKQEVDERAEFETTVNDLRDLAQVS